MNRIRSLTALLFITAGMQLVSANTVIPADTLLFLGNELLSRPANQSICINACASKALDVYYEFGTDSNTYTTQSAIIRTTDSIPFSVTLTGLQANTQYFYRMKYRLAGSSVYTSRTSRTFHTSRPPGSSYTFAIEADPHMDTNSLASVWNLTLQNMLLKKPDFLLDLGDTFMGEKLPVITRTELLKRQLYIRTFFDQVCHSTPLFLVQGNHDGELGWRLDSTATCMPVVETILRKQYYPNPVPDAFYSGNSKTEPYVGLRENYYAWEWGNALFIVLDPYWYTRSKPGWGWSLGLDQYNWLKNTLANSNAKFKFVFCHQLVGGNGNDGRGGIEYAPYWEMGGRNSDSSWGFANNRAGWAGPIHSLMKSAGAQIFFHGHDHFYGKQDWDGIVYQEVPQPSLKSYTNNSAANYGYVNGVILPNRGYLLVTITDTTAKVDYIRTYLPNEENATRHNGDISHSYTVYAGTGTALETDYLPETSGFSLQQNFPNPFNPNTRIVYSLGTGGITSLRVYNSIGQNITTLLHEYQPAGSHSVVFNPAAVNLPSGVYYCNLVSGAYAKTIKMIYLK